MATEKFEITRQIGIDAGHRIPDHKSKCKNLHGHRYEVHATAIGELITEGSETGMVTDFSFLKELMMRVIDENFDHGLIMYYDDPLLVKIMPYALYVATFGEAKAGKVMPVMVPDFGKMAVIPMVPTAENLAKLWYDMLSNEMRLDGVKAQLKSVRVFETPNCSALYEGEHNG